MRGSELELVDIVQTSRRLKTATHFVSKSSSMVYAKDGERQCRAAERPKAYCGAPAVAVHGSAAATAAIHSPHMPSEACQNASSRHEPRQPVSTLSRDGAAAAATAHLLLQCTAHA
eukprot:TRINITY_DN3376_c0_g1_i1.p2 TRINITY_DN3376_c0_g1~~TRINITY_DN3376_c0_g1_i1.p2  ORF type:complete len:116 (-),score=11.97 TRINITY_DN3376_c0_g1_i1:204-551(-)